MCGVCVCVCVCMTLLLHTCEKKRKICQSQFFSSTMWIAGVMAILGCQLDCIWMNYNTEMEDTPVIQILREEDNMSLVWILRL